MKGKNKLSSIGDMISEQEKLLGISDSEDENSENYYPEKSESSVQVGNDFAPRAGERGVPNFDRIFNALEEGRQKASTRNGGLNKMPPESIYNARNYSAIDENLNEPENQIFDQNENFQESDNTEPELNLEPETDEAPNQEGELQNKQEMDEKSDPQEKRGRDKLKKPNKEKVEQEKQIIPQEDERFFYNPDTGKKIVDVEDKQEIQKKNKQNAERAEKRLKGGKINTALTVVSNVRKILTGLAILSIVAGLACMVAGIIFPPLLPIGGIIVGASVASLAGVNIAGFMTKKSLKIAKRVSDAKSKSKYVNNSKQAEISRTKDQNKTDKDNNKTLGKKDFEMKLTIPTKNEVKASPPASLVAKNEYTPKPLVSNVTRQPSVAKINNIRASQTTKPNISSLALAGFNGAKIIDNNAKKGVQGRSSDLWSSRLLNSDSKKHIAQSGGVHAR